MVMVPFGARRKPCAELSAVKKNPTIVPAGLMAAGKVNCEPGGSNTVMVPFAARTKPWKPVTIPVIVPPGLMAEGKVSEPGVSNTVMVPSLVRRKP